MTLVLQGLELGAHGFEGPGPGVRFITPTAIFLIDDSGVRRLSAARGIAALLSLVGLAMLVRARRA